MPATTQIQRDSHTAFTEANEAGLFHSTGEHTIGHYMYMGSTQTIYDNGSMDIVDSFKHIITREYFRVTSEYEAWEQIS